VRGLAWLREASAAGSLLFLVLLAATGGGLMASYVPSAAEAFPSVAYLRQSGGSFLRSLHYHAASALVVSGFLYLLSSFLEGRLSRQRRVWWAAVSLFGLVLASGFTGFLLPMDQNAYWGTLVRLGIVETAPGLGPLAADLLRGGPALNASTLPRFYALHVSVLPFFVILALLPLRAEAKAVAGDPPRRRRALAAAFLLLFLTFGLALVVPAPFEPRASPSDTTYVPRPEWYFTWLFQLGKYVGSFEWIRSLLVPALGLGLAVALPFLPAGTLAVRAAAAAVAGLFFAGLTGLSRHDDRWLPPKASYEQALAARAAETFARECLDCHGARGRGDGPQARTFGLEPPDFTAPNFWKDTPIPRMKLSIRDGRGEDMPAFGKKITEEDIDALVARLQERFRPASERTQGKPVNP
jgi:ubiquinol-cytochrome c reductase cytochrome b subunit